MENGPRLQKLRGADIHRLGVFKAVVESGGLSSAADALGVDLSTVSRQIKDLEIRLGLELCQRGPGGFALTSQGHTAYEVACLLVETLQACEERLEGLRDGLSGVLHVGVVNHLLSTPELRFPEVLRIMRRKAPNLVIDCKVLTPGEIMRQVESRQLHLGILGTSEQPAELVFTPIFREEAGLYCAAGHPLYEDRRTAFGREALEGMAYVARTHGSPTDLRAQSLGLVAEIGANDIDVILSLVQSGLYLGFLPVHAIEALKQGAALRRLPLEGPECAVPFYACTLRRVSRSRRTELFLRVLHGVSAA
ncbi:LysR family transcriptional regulator [Paracoccus sp. pheM1]|uniref:LysR family transcriptional regulator n=1 Tax=Paracoccus sp. pheM1 TaxID=2831675 RepID=UPI001BDB8EEF|nr:LysR family transcriptional regulator [Paracoccus sp. pheM1]MBT0781454.1 LysR family transcriptional regulator [Paracoccus sp. pheM1]